MRATGVAALHEQSAQRTAGVLECAPMPGPLSRTAPPPAPQTAPTKKTEATPAAAPGAPPKTPIAGSADELAQARKKLQSLGLTNTRQPAVTRSAGPAMTPAQLLTQNAKQAAAATTTNATQELGKSSGFGHHSARGKISEKEWADPTLLMGKLTQYPAGRKTAQSEAVCGPSNLLGAKMLSGGPVEAGKFLLTVAHGPGKLDTASRVELAAIGQRVLDKTATFEDLNKAQELLYRAVNTDADAMSVVAMANASGKLNAGEQKKLRAEMLKYINDDNPMSRDATEINRLLRKALGPDVDFEKGGWNRMDVTDARRTRDTSGLSDAEFEPLGKLAGGEQVQLDQHADFESLAKDLKPGESLTFRLAGDDKSGAPDHYVTLGRRPDPDGRLYLYNPDPGNKDHTLVVGAFPPDAKFGKTLGRYTDRLRNEGDSFPPVTRTPVR